jgi:hypothetical protein
MNEREKERERVSERKSLCRSPQSARTASAARNVRRPVTLDSLTPVCQLAALPLHASARVCRAGSNTASRAHERGGWSDEGASLL